MYDRREDLALGLSEQRSAFVESNLPLLGVADGDGHGVLITDSGLRAPDGKVVRHWGLRYRKTPSGQVWISGFRTGDLVLEQQELSTRPAQTFPRGSTELFPRVVNAWPWDKGLLILFRVSGLSLLGRMTWDAPGVDFLLAGEGTLCGKISNGSTAVLPRKGDGVLQLLNIGSSELVRTITPPALDEQGCVSMAPGPQVEVVATGLKAGEPVIAIFRNEIWQYVPLPAVSGALLADRVGAWLVVRAPGANVRTRDGQDILGAGALIVFRASTLDLERVLVAPQPKNQGAFAMAVEAQSGHLEVSYADTDVKELRERNQPIRQLLHEHLSSCRLHLEE